MFRSEDIRKEVARRFGVAAYQVFVAEGDACLCAVGFAVAELGKAGVTVVGGVSEGLTAALALLAEDKGLTMDTVDDIAMLSHNDSCIVAAHRDVITGGLLKVKKLIRRAKCLNSVVVIDASQTADNIGIDFNGLDIDICIIDKAVIIADRCLRKSYRYLGERYFVHEFH